MAKNYIIKDSNGKDVVYENVDKVVLTDTDGIDREFVEAAEVGVNGLQWKCDNIKSLANEFAGYTGTSLDVPLAGLDTSNVTNFSQTFSNNTKLESLPQFDTSSNTTFYRTFYACSNLGEIAINATNATTLQSCFEGCSKIESINLVSTHNVTNFSEAFYNCSSLNTLIGLDLYNATDVSTFVHYSKLTTLDVKNIKIGCRFGATTQWGTNLSKDSVINVIKELWDNSSSTTTLGVSFSTTTKTLLSDVYVKLITPTAEQIAADPYINNKKPCEVCASTDEGAMLITDYATLKNWTIN